MEGRNADYLRPARSGNSSQTKHPRLPTLKVIALVGFGSLLGLPGILLSELSFFAVAPWLSAPVIEEIMKPFGLYILVLKWPGNVKRQLNIALLSGLAGLCFGIFESVMYVFSYTQNQLDSDYVLFRFTIPVLLHVTASTIFGLSISERNLRAVMLGDVKRKSLWGYPAAAIVVHAAYNIAVTIWNPDF